MSEFVAGLAVLLFTFGGALILIQLIDRWEIETNLREWRRKRAARRWWAEFQTWRNRRG